MYTLRVEAAFAAAHYLSHYHGKCENLHGHNYRVRLWVRGETLDAGGMLVDFGALKTALREAVALLDHRNLNDLPEFAGDPSAERVAAFLYRRVRERGVRPLAVDVFETPGSMARYTERRPGR